MHTNVIIAALVSAVATLSAHATDMSAIIAKVSENCDKIRSYSADAVVRYII
jgi:outer membrane lipoprotein-sorting protein